MSLLTLPKVEKLRAALHAKAKGSPNFRFYSLYDKVYCEDVLWDAYQRWANYFHVGTVRDVWERIDWYVFHRLRQWWCAKHRVRNRRDRRFSSAYLYGQLGVVRLSRLRARFTCAYA